MKVLIRASAGSGKTFQLSGHFLRQLFLGDPPESILATTFTRKAAGEILGRVLTRLADAAADSSKAAELGQFLAPACVTQDAAAELLAKVTHDLHRVRVCTLDSFFQQVARSLTLELGLPPGWSIVDEHTDRELREEAIDAVLSQQIPQDAQRLMQMLAKGRSKRSIRDLIDETVSDFHELYLLSDASAWNLIPAQRRLTQQEQDDALENLAEAAIPDGKQFVAARSADIERFRASDWEGFLTTGIAAKIVQGETSFGRKEIPQSLISIYRKLVAHAKAEVLDRIAAQMAAIRDLISRFDTAYNRLRNEHGWLKFGDVTRVLASAGKEASGNRMNFRLDSSIRNLLLDEFQDTSSDQWSILRRLAEHLKSRGDKATFFCVGDDKQAIYGWRGGVAEILGAVKEVLPDVNEEMMHTSRRSSTAVITTVNEIFSGLRKHTNLGEYEDKCVEWSQRFPAHGTAKDKLPGYVCFRTSPLLEGASAEERRVPFYKWVAQQIRELHRQSPGAEIGVLTRRNETVARLVYEMTVLGIPASEEGGTAPTDSPAILAVISLLFLSAHPSCRTSRYHVATSPLGPMLRLKEKNDEGSRSAADVAEEMRARLLDDGYGRTLQWISDSVREDCSARDRLRLQQIVAEGWHFDQTGSLNPCDFIRLIENSRYQKAEPAPIRVMTVHQSKGLEFDVVVLPELEAQLFRSPKAAWSSPSLGEKPDRVCVWTSKDLRALLPESLRHAFEATISRTVAESLCVFYVAVTRARFGLHLLSPPVQDKSLPKSQAGLLLAALGNAGQAPPETTVYETGDPQWFKHVAEMMVPKPEPKKSEEALVPNVKLSAMTDGRRRGLRRRAPSRHDETVLYFPSPAGATANTKGRRGKASAAELSTAVVTPRIKGTVFHAWFECIEWLDEESAGPEESVLRAKAKESSVPEDIVNSLLPQFRQLLQSADIRRVFEHRFASDVPAFRQHKSQLRDGNAALQVHRERSFIRLDKGEIVQGTIDRLTLLVLGGKPVAADIIDFKTDRLAGTPNEWIEEKRAGYRLQLSEYRSAVAHCFQIPLHQISSRLLLVEASVLVDA